jgi:hypothetical protein
MPAAAKIEPLFERDEPYHYHDETRPGFLSLLRQLPSDGRMVQRSFALARMGEELLKLQGLPDVWISQCEFFKPNRRIVNLWRMPLSFVDLDTYKVEHLTRHSPEALVQSLLLWCQDCKLPEPSLIVFSGRGLQVKWVFNRPIPTKALPRWQAVQRELFSQLADLGADARALDASRVLRLVDTTNSRSGEKVRIVHMARTPTMGAERLASGLIAYDFDVFADSVLPISRGQLQEHRKERKFENDKGKTEKAARQARMAQFTVVSGANGPRASQYPNLRKFIPHQLAWDRLADMRTLAKQRGFDSGLPSGQRDIFLFLCACFLANAVIVPKLPLEIMELAHEFAPTWSDADVTSCVSSVLARAAAAARGETVTFSGKEVSPLYRWHNATLIERLSITPQEERRLGTIISKTEASRRDAQRHKESRRVAGGRSREEGLQERTALCARAKLLRANGNSYPAIARELGIGLATAHRYCQQ